MGKQTFIKTRDEWTASELSKHYKLLNKNDGVYTFVFDESVPFNLAFADSKLELTNTLTF